MRTQAITFLLVGILVLSSCVGSKPGYWISDYSSGNPHVITFAQTVDNSIEPDRDPVDLEILHPFNGAVLPADMASPAIEWRDFSPMAKLWLVTLYADWMKPVYYLARTPDWTPPAGVWEKIKQKAELTPLRIKIIGLDSEKEPEVLSAGSSQVFFSEDRVEAPILYRQTPPVFDSALKHPEMLKWRLGDVSSYETPKVVMENQPICGSCHHASADGRHFGMDMDFRKDKGAYALVPLTPKMEWSAKDFISWNDFPRIDSRKSTGLFSRISPDGRYVISTVNEISLLIKRDDIYFSQLF